MVLGTFSSDQLSRPLDEFGNGVGEMLTRFDHSNNPLGDGELDRSAPSGKQHDSVSPKHSLAELVHGQNIDRYGRSIVAAVLLFEDIGDRSCQPQRVAIKCGLVETA